MKEIWKDIKGYEGIYKISNLSRVKRIYKNVKGDSKDEHILSQKLGKRGYYYVNLSKRQRYKSKTIHRLVAIAFIPNPKNKPTINHKDGNKLNNNIKNLEWATYKENSNHAWKNNLYNPKPLKGEDNPRSKFTNTQVIAIRNQYKNSNISYTELSIKYGVDASTIRKMILGITYNI
jgi:hypothetical protein